MISAGTSLYWAETMFEVPNFITVDYLLQKSFTRNATHSPCTTPGPKLDCAVNESMVLESSKDFPRQKPICKLICLESLEIQESPGSSPSYT